MNGKTNFRSFITCLSVCFAFFLNSALTIRLRLIALGEFLPAIWCIKRRQSLTNAIEINIIRFQNIIFLDDNLNSCEEVRTIPDPDDPLKDIIFRVQYVIRISSIYNSLQSGKLHCSCKKD